MRAVAIARQLVFDGRSLLFRQEPDQRKGSDRRLASTLYAAQRTLEGSADFNLQIIYRPAIPPDPSTPTAERKGVPMESSEQDRPTESRGQRATTKLDRAGDQNAGLVNIMHVLFVLTIVALIVAYVADKA